MSEQFKVSVIIPVYKAADYVTAAVVSADSIEVVDEIILVEDNSPDNSLEICKILAQEYNKVTLLQHPNGENKGAGASRNLGIKSARNAYVSFLDADDVYLPGRFEQDIQILKDKNVDGAYNAIAPMLDSQYAIDMTKKTFRLDNVEDFLLTVRDPVASHELFNYLLFGGKGHFSTNGITLKRNVFEKVGYFNKLKLHQDTHMWLRIALECVLVPGELNRATALYRVHEGNRIKNFSKESKLAYCNALYADLHKKVKNKAQFLFLIKKKIAANAIVHKQKIKNIPAIIYYSVLHFLRNPEDILRLIYFRKNA